MTGELVPTTKVPAEWPGLIEHAEAAVPEFADLRTGLVNAKFLDLWYLHRNLDSQAPHLAALGRTINDLDMTAVEANRYHALRYPIAILGKLLEDPSTKEQIIESGSELLITKTKGPKSKPNIEHGLANNGVQTAFRQIVDKAYWAVPEPVRLAGELLTMASLQRLDTLEVSRRPFKRPWRARYRQVHHLNSINDYNPQLRETLEKASSGGASVLCRTALDRDGQFQDSGIPSPEALAGLRHDSFPGVARRAAASKRAVDITEHHAKIFGHQEGHLTFHYSPNPKPDRSDAQPLPKHEALRRYFERDKTLGCPAVREGKSVETVLDMLVSMVELACVKLEEAD